MHFKRGKARNARAGCKLCKPRKVNGFRTGRLAGEKFSDHRRRSATTLAARHACDCGRRSRPIGTRPHR